MADPFVMLCFKKAQSAKWIKSNLELEQRGGQVYLRVSDHGMGISKADQAQLFQRFFRASRSNPQQISGLGIGLYVVGQIVTLHGGTVSVVSEEGHGSTFSIALPLLPTL